MMLEKETREAAKRLAAVDAAVDDLVSPHREQPLVRAIAFASELGDQPQLRLISGFCLAWGLASANARLARAGIRTLLAHEIATLAKNFVKDEVDRKRPRTARSKHEQKPRRGRSSRKEDTSFPSGHTAGSVAVARAFSREFPEHRIAALTVAGALAAAQVPRCAHYVTDVGAGAAVGLVSEAVANGLWAVEKE